MAAKARYKRINIEISNICNLQCSFCPEVHREKHVMSESLFRSVIAQVAPLTEEVCLHLMGEPMGHPQLSQFIDICAQFKVPVNFTSNGTLLNNRILEILLRPIVRQVNFSVHSFEANFGARDVSTYMAKVFGFTRAAFEQRPDLYINYRIWDLNDSVSLSPANVRIREAIEKEFGFKLEKQTIDLRRRKGYKVVNRLYINLDSRFVWPSLSAPFRSEKGFCHGLSNHFGIHANGVVVPCCLDKEADLSLGNCQDEPIETILASDRARKIKAGFEKGVCVEQLCQKCDFISRFDNKSKLV